MPPLISCLIPVYNAQEFLEVALDSIQKQSFRDFEILAVNDGSTDGSLNILETRAASDPRIRILSKPNGGIVSALNHGLEHCRGRLVARMDADDIALPDRFAVQMAAFETHPDAVAVGGLIQSIDGRGRPIAPPGSPSRVQVTDITGFPPVVANVQHSAGTFLKSALEAVGGYRSNFPHAEDYDLYLRLAGHGTFYNPPKLVLYYRVHSASLPMMNLERQETSAVLAELSAYARREGLPDPGDADRPLTLDEYSALLGDLCPKQTIQRYIEFRTWRRLWGARSKDEPRYRKAVLKRLAMLSNNLSPMARGLNRRIVLSMGRKLLRIAREKSTRLVRRPEPVKLAG